MVPEIVTGMTPVIPPNITVTGKQLNLLRWTFNIPAWSYLHDNIEFKGKFHPLLEKDITLNKVKVDVVQHELYFYDVSWYVQVNN